MGRPSDGRLTNEVHENGIILKFRYPQGLVYVPNSGAVIIEQDETPIKPRFNVVNRDEESVYLVFFLPPKALSTTWNGILGELWHRGGPTRR
jgi:hypothetical protein